MHARSDRELVQRTLRGDADAFATLSEQCADSVYAVAYARLLRHADAEDVTQETFLRAYEKLGQLREPDRFESWVHRIAMTLTYDALRRRARETPMDTQQLLEDTAERRDDYDAFAREADARRLVEPALRTLPEHLRVAFVMRHMAEASYVTIARRLHISPTAAQRRVERAHRRLQSYLRRVEACEVAPSLALASPMGEPFLARLRDAWSQGSPPARYAAEAHAAPRMAGVLAAGVVTTAALFAGVYGAHTRLLHWGDLRVEGALRYVEPAASLAPAAHPSSDATDRGAALELIAPGEEWTGWAPSEPDGDATVPTRAAASGPLGRDVAVVRNDFGVYKAFPPTRGELTVDVWLRASGRDTNASLGFTLGRDGEGPPVRIAMLHRLDGETWNYIVHDAGAVPFQADDRAWHRATITYGTHDATYDLDFDGEPIATGVPSNPALAGRAVNGVHMHSGRGGRGAPLHFTRMRVSARNAEPGRNATAPVVGDPGPRSTPDRVVPRSGRIGDVVLAPRAPSYEAYPGERLRGFLSVSVTNDHGPAADVYVIETPTWGDHRTAFRAVVGPLSPGRHEVRVEIDRIAPTVPGTYYIIVASSAETAPEFVASGTNWSNDRARWDDATDIAGWPETLILEAMREGHANARWRVGGDLIGRISLGATAVCVVVTEAENLAARP